MISFSEKIKKSQAVVGTWSNVASPVMTEIASRSGLDFILLDLEHGAFDLTTLENCIRAAELHGTAALVRVPRFHDSLTCNVLDMGAQGIVFPMIENANDAETAVRATLYPPRGTRGLHPFTRATGHGMKQAGGFKPTVAVIVETIGAYQDLDRILAIPEIDVVYLGGYDMSVAFGVPGNLDHPKMVEFFSTSIPKIKKAKKAPGVFFRSESDLKRYAESGATFFVYGVDSLVYSEAMGAARGFVSNAFPDSR